MNWFVLYSDRIICFYYGADKSIYQRIYSGGKWSKAVCVISDARSGYSVMRDEEGDCVLCQESSGNMILCRQSNGSWKNSVILEAKSMSPPDMLMTRIGNSIVYNLPNGKEHTLILQQQKNGKWERSVMIDSFIPFRDCVYRLHTLNDGRMLLIYRKNTVRQVLGFRIIDQNGNIGDFKTVYSSNSVITDCSFIVENNFIHFAAAVKGGFSSRIVYVLADEHAAENNAAVVWEGSGTDLASIRRSREKTIINHSASNRLYTFVSTENGFKGSDLKRVSGSMKKACVLNGNGINDVIVPHDRPYDIDISVFKE